MVTVATTLLRVMPSAMPRLRMVASGAAADAQLRARHAAHDGAIVRRLEEARAHAEQRQRGAIMCGSEQEGAC